MTEFTKMKISFALALLGTLFALHPFLDRFDDAGFVYLGYNLKVVYPYALTAALLSLCVYLYGLTLMTDRPHSWLERTGNSAYSLAVLVVPIYAGLYLSALLADRVAVSHVAWAAPAVAAGTGLGWVALSQLVAWRIRARMGEQDMVAKMAQLGHQEVESLNKAREMLAGDHYDLCVLEAWKALEARLRQALMARGVVTRAGKAYATVHLAARKGILREPALGVVAEVQRSWEVAVSTDPLPRESAVAALAAVRHMLSIIPVHRSGGRDARPSTMPAGEFAPTKAA